MDTNLDRDGKTENKSIHFNPVRLFILSYALELCERPRRTLLSFPLGARVANSWHACIEIGARLATCCSKK